eukprot:scaffold242057_cov15-Prasinocladus_malaysianus.AAC.1
MPVFVPLLYGWLAVASDCRPSCMEIFERQDVPIGPVTSLDRAVDGHEGTSVRIGRVDLLRSVEATVYMNAYIVSKLAARSRQLVWKGTLPVKHWVSHGASRLVVAFGAV